MGMGCLPTSALPISLPCEPRIVLFSYSIWTRRSVLPLFRRCLSVRLKPQIAPLTNLPTTRNTEQVVSSLQHKIRDSTDVPLTARRNLTRLLVTN